MKRKEIIIIVFVAMITALLSFVLSGVLFGSPKTNPIRVPVVTKINSSFPSVKIDENYKYVFNEQALNPTQLIQIGGNSNTTPFQGSQ